MAATTGCLRALGVSCDATDVAGHSGYAFLLNIAEAAGVDLDELAQRIVTESSVAYAPLIAALRSTH